MAQLSEFDSLVGTTLLRRELRKRGFLLSERTTRYHLQLLEAKDFVLEHDRSGRTITPQGLEELSRALGSQRLGFTITRFLSMAYSATYDPTGDSGTVVANVSARWLKVTLIAITYIVKNWIYVVYDWLWNKIKWGVKNRVYKERSNLPISSIRNERKSRQSS